MRLLSLVAPGGGPAQRAVSGALAEWSRGLDIRLRFLNIGTEETVLVLPAGEGPALRGAEEALGRAAPEAVLLHGRGPEALAAAISASKAGVPLLRTAAGRRDGPATEIERAADRLAAVLLAETPEDAAALEAEGLSGAPFTPAAAVKAVIRLPRQT